MIGCCGFGSAMTPYFETFEAVEVQHTFYHPPQLKTLDKWRDQSQPDFEFTIKAWQLITHESKSPTYRRLKRELTETEKSMTGRFQSSALVREAWDVTLESARTLGATRILFQCPGSFKPTDENIANMRQFFTGLDRGGMILYWEPRGKDWTDQVVAELCEELQISHAVDPFVSKCQTPADSYFRLHGKGGWRYRYTDTDLAELVKMLPRKGRAYVFFNNISMVADAQRFTKLLATT